MPEKECFYRSTKEVRTDDNGEKLDGHINDEKYLTRKKFWKEFGMKNIGDYQDHYLKKRCFVIS